MKNYSNITVKPITGAMGAEVVDVGVDGGAAPTLGQARDDRAAHHRVEHGEVDAAVDPLRPGEVPRVDLELHHALAIGGAHDIDSDGINSTSAKRIAHGGAKGVITLIQRRAVPVMAETSIVCGRFTLDCGRDEIAVITANFNQRVAGQAFERHMVDNAGS